MRVYQVRGYPASHYFVANSNDWHEITHWMRKNEIDYLHESSSQHGYGFSIRKNFEWFSLRWL